MSNKCVRLFSNGSTSVMTYVLTGQKRNNKTKKKKGRDITAHFNMAKILGSRCGGNAENKPQLTYRCFIRSTKVQLKDGYYY